MVAREQEERNVILRNEGRAYFRHCYPTVPKTQPTILNEIQINRATVIHLPQLQRIGRQTFQETFADVNTEEDMKQYLEESFSAEKLTGELTNSNAEFYLATFGQEEVGYLKVNFGEAQTELKDSNAVEIERIYVSKAFHGKKVGQLLYEKALNIAHERKADYVWLGVWEKNLRAIAFYQKNGFVEFGQHIFKLGDDEQTDLMMRLQLN